MLFEIVVVQTMFGQEIVNRWNYTSTSTPAAVSMSFALAAAFGAIPLGTPGVLPADSVFGKIRAYTSQDLHYDEVIVKNIYSVTDFYTAPFSALVGGFAESAASPFLAFGFRTNRVRADIARGTKRLAGVCESGMLQGGNLDAFALTNVQAMADKMEESIVYTDEGSPLTFTPCIVQKQKYTPVGSTKPAYRYYPTLVEQEAHLATGIQWQPYEQVRSQVSRQYSS